VTGASGFIGANLVHEFVARGHSVKALVRSTSDLRGLRGADFERVEGDVTQRERLQSAMRGCDWCFHAAASYHLQTPNGSIVAGCASENSANCLTCYFSLPYLIRRQPAQSFLLLGGGWGVDPLELGSSVFAFKIVVYLAWIAFHACQYFT